MARSIQQIHQQILAQVAAEPNLTGLNSVSTTSIYNLWAYVTATIMFFQETLWDIFKTNLETDIAKAPVGTDSWVSSQSYKFQYDAMVPQIIHLTNFVPAYDTIDLTKQIITRVSVKTSPLRIVNVKVAKQEPPIKLTPTELTSFKGYLDEISFAGVQYNAISLDADQVLIGAQVYYNGQYSASIQADVILALNNYLSSVPFDGFIRLSKIEDAIQSVTGVNDVILNNVAIRAALTVFSSTTYMLQSNLEIFNKYPMFAGYAVGETTGGSTFTDLLVFIPE